MIYLNSLTLHIGGKYFLRSTFRNGVPGGGIGKSGCREII